MEKNKKINVKLFKNGSIHLTGCKLVIDSLKTLSIIFNKLKKIVASFDLINIIERPFVSNIDLLNLTYLNCFKVAMINSNFNIGFRINRNNLYFRLLWISMNVLMIHVPHACVNIKYIYKDNNQSNDLLGGKQKEETLCFPSRTSQEGSNVFSCHGSLGVRGPLKIRDQGSYLSQAAWPLDVNPVPLDLNKGDFKGTPQFSKGSLLVVPKIISIFVFESGAIIITGATNNNHIITAYKFINNYLINNFEYIQKKILI